MGTRAEAARESGAAGARAGDAAAPAGRTVVLDAVGRTALSVVWLHGMGHGPEHMAAVAERLALPESGVRGVFPCAPAQAVSPLTGRTAAVWFRQSVERLWQADLPTLRSAERHINELLDAEVERFGADRVALAGFSQGAVTALYSGLRYRRPLAGIAVYAAFPLRGVDFFDAADRSTAGVPVWMGHGVRDWVVPYRIGREVHGQLADRGHPVSWYRYRGGHEVFGGVGAELAGFFETLREQGTGR